LGATVHFCPMAVRTTLWPLNERVTFAFEAAEQLTAG
jgi:hypothetical protein